MRVDVIGTLPSRDGTPLSIHWHPTREVAEPPVSILRGYRGYVLRKPLKDPACVDLQPLSLCFHVQIGQP
jgi:hypothetical protein